MAHGYRASRMSNHCGYDYWSARKHNRNTLNKARWLSPTRHKYSKKLTYREERKMNKQIIQEDLHELY